MTARNDLPFCDVCDRQREVAIVWACGIETAACDECRGVEPGAYGEDERLDDPRHGQAASINDRGIW